MTTNVPLSILELATVGVGQTGADALRATLDLAVAADRLGYRRLWFAEHHLAPGVASASPAVLAALAAERTRRLRVGSGAVLLGTTSPLIAAEQFGTIAALHPGRVDLGLGRAFTPAGPRGSSPRRRDGRRATSTACTCRARRRSTSPTPRCAPGSSRRRRSSAPAAAGQDFRAERRAGPRPARRHLRRQRRARLREPARRGCGVRPVGAGVQRRRERARRRRARPAARGELPRQPRRTCWARSRRTARRSGRACSRSRTSWSPPTCSPPRRPSGRSTSRTRSPSGCCRSAAARRARSPTRSPARRPPWERRSAADQDVLRDRDRHPDRRHAGRGRGRSGHAAARDGADELLVTTETHDPRDRVRSFELLAGAWGLHADVPRPAAADASADAHDLVPSGA